jgi:hypothetical protein
MLAAVAAACAAVGLAACSASGSAPAAPATHSAPAPASQAPAAGSPAATPAASPAADSGTGGGTAASGPLPDYQPSTLVSKSASSTVLTSPDAVGKISAFYKDALARGGWQVTSSSMSAYHASFTAYRSSEGASISVYAQAGGSGISISTHPR